jgi:hypothetical protein
VTTPLKPPALLSDGDLQKLNKLIKDCADTDCMLDKLESLGLDVSQMRTDNGSMAKFAAGAKSQFFPHQP